MWTRFLSVALFFIFESTLGDSGMEFVLTPNGTNFIGFFLRDAVTTELQGSKIEYFKKQELHFLGTSAEVELSNLMIRDMAVSNVSVAPLPGVGVKAEIRDMSMKTDCDWKYEMDPDALIRLSDNGTVSTLADNVDVDLVLKLVSDKGRPAFSVVSCNATVGEFMPQFGGTFGFLYNFFIQFFRDQIKVDIQNSVCDGVTQLVTREYSKKLQALKMLAKLNHHLTLDYSMDKQPLLGPNFIKTFHKGNFLSDAVVLPTTNMAAPMDRMAGWAISETVLNSALRVFHSSSWSKISAESDSWKDLATKLRISSNLTDGPSTVTLQTETPPAASVSPSGVALSLQGVLNVRPKDAPAAVGPSQTVKFSFRVTGNVFIGSDRLQVNLTSISLVLNSAIPPIPGINVGDFNKAMVLLCQLLLPRVNERFAGGWELPTFYGMSLTNATLDMKSRFLSLASNLDYNS